MLFRSPVVDQIARDVARVLDAPDFREWVTSSGGQPMNMAQPAFARFVLSESKSAARVIEAAGLTR